ncbi:hypothetical protein OAJ57_04310, partial [Alphaproteobacteria bacterium]|nr:hypothetical protein [Alphaproteobacteria bacterium]
SDGAILRVNIFRPDVTGLFPAIMAKAAYDKEVHFRDGYRLQRDRFMKMHRTFDTDGTNGQFLRWQTKCRGVARLRPME